MAEVEEEKTSAPEDVKGEGIDIRFNLPCQIEVLEGSWAEQGTMSNETPDKFLIGSEIKPVKLTSIREGNFNNGTGKEKDYFLIIQGCTPVIVLQEVISHNYGCEYMKNGGEANWRAEELERVEEIEQGEEPSCFKAEKGSWDEYSDEDLKQVKIRAEKVQKVGEIMEGDFENGEGQEYHFWIIIQNGKAYLALQEFVIHSYGCEYAKNGGEADFRIYKLPVLPEA